MHKTAVMIQHTDIPVSSRVTLGALVPADFDDLVRHINDPLVYDNTLTIPYPYHIKHAEEYLSAIRYFEETQGIQKDWVIRFDGRYIGGIGLLYNYGADSHKSEIGYWLSRDFRGQGLMSAVIGAFCKHVFDQTPLIRLEAHVFVGNTASARVLEKNGFALEGIARATFIKNGVVKDTWQYARIREAELK